MPFSAVGENTYIAMIKTHGPLTDVSGQLHFRLNPHIANPQVSLDLEDGLPDLNVDPAALPNRRL